MKSLESHIETTACCFRCQIAAADKETTGNIEKAPHWEIMNHGGISKVHQAGSSKYNKRRSVCSKSFEVKGVGDQVFRQEQMQMVALSKDAYHPG